MISRRGFLIGGALLALPTAAHARRRLHGGAIESVVTPLVCLTHQREACRSSAYVELPLRFAGREPLSVHFRPAGADEWIATPHGHLVPLKWRSTSRLLVFPPPAMKDSHVEVRVDFRAQVGE